MSLALKYRPYTFDDLVGQRVVQVVLRQMVSSGRVHPALLFTGPPGTGKTTSARVLGAALNCDQHPAVPCGHCVSCKSVFETSSVDVIEIDAASNGLVDDIRQLRAQVQYGTAGRYRVVILDEAQSCSAAAFNALLKTLEEPPPATVFVLLTTEPGRIPDTVLSRCMPFNFKRISIVDIVDRLGYICAKESIPADDAMLRALAERADGGLRDAVMLLDQVSRIGVTTVEGFTELIGDIDFGPDLLAALHSGDPARTYAAVNEQVIRSGDSHAIADGLAGTIRDVLILRSGGTITKQGDALAARQRLADAINTGTLFAAMKVLWDYKTRIRVGTDPRIGLDLAIATMLPVFHLAVPAEPSVPARKLTLAEMVRR